MKNSVLRPQTDEESQTSMKYLTFWIDAQLFGIPATDIVQIVELQDMVKIPEFPPYARGVINIRGNMIPVIDVRRRFGKPENPDTRHACIVIAAVEDQAVGFLVDTVYDMCELTEEMITPAPGGIASDASSFFLWGIGNLEEQAIFLMDTRKMIYEEDKAVVLPAASNR